MRIYFTLFLVLIGGCDTSTKTKPVVQPVPTCSPYFVADFNNIIRLDRLKNGYSAEMTGLCTGFQLRHKALTRCGAYQEATGSLEVVNTSTIEVLCGRNERLAATINSRPSLLSTEAKDPNSLQFKDSGEVTLKFMVLDVTPFMDVRNSTRDFNNRKAFSSGRTYPLSSLRAAAAYCLVDSSAPLQNNDMIQVTQIEDSSKNQKRTLNYAADVYRGQITVSISCVGVPAKTSPKAILVRHLGASVMVE